MLAGLLKSGGKRAFTSSVLISSNSDEISSLKSGFLVVVVDDAAAAASSDGTEAALNPGGKNLLMSSFIKVSIKEASFVVF